MTKNLITPVIIFFFVLFLAACNHQPSGQDTSSDEKDKTTHFFIKTNDDRSSIEIYREGGTVPVVVQNAKPDFRPYLHPIQAPGSDAELTQYSPGHHKHQTGLYWGFTRVNGTGIAPDELKKWFYRRDKSDKIKKQIGRDFFHHPEGDHWQRVSANVLKDEGELLKWQTVYNMLDENGDPILKETQNWTFEEKDSKYLLSLEWKGEALIDVTINEFEYGGMFLRMPWKKDIKGEVVNAARQRNAKAEGQRAMWVDVGMEIDGLDEWGHIAIFDHPDNQGFPQTWRVDGQMGVGPVRALMGDWTIKKGETETIQHQIVAYTGQHNDLAMNQWWSDYIGDKGMYITASLWGIAQEEGRNAEFLTPEKAVESMTITEGFQVNAWASEPMITQPMAFCWDDKGRMWIAENRDYESRGGGFSNSGDSRILILEDTDNDGVADSKKVFLEGIPFPAGIATGFDGLFLGAPPNLLFIPDKDKDDKADMEDLKVLLTGWGIRDRHETINSLHWGPDGWLYGLEGFATPSKIRKPKGKGKLYKHKEPFPEDLLEAEGVDINGGVWRYHPIKDKFEVVAHGFSNPWGIDYDAKGQLFITACVIPHMFHVVPGGIYHRQGGQHFNPYVYKDIRTIVDHSHRSAHGGARVYLSDAFPQEQYGRLFMANIHEHAVLTDILQPKGSGFVAQHGEDFLLANNAQWIGFSMEIGPGGNVYVLDWHDADICGKEVLNKETGRIFRITPDNSQAENWEGRYADLNTFNDVQLAGLQQSKSSWHARRARTILQYRATKGQISTAAQSTLQNLLDNNGNSDYRLRALWTMHQSNLLTEDQLVSLLSDKDEHIRAWSVQLICEDEEPGEKSQKKFADMAANDDSPVVRLYLAAALQRMNQEDRWPIAEALVQRGQDADDHNIPKMIWFGIESLVGNNQQKALTLANKSQLPMITQFIARRIVDADQTAVLVNHISKNAANQKDLLRGFLDGLEGKPGAKAPESWKSLYAQLKKDEHLSDLALEIAQRFGDSDAASQYLALLKNQSARSVDRQNAITVLANQKREELIAEIPGLLKNDDLRATAIRAVASYNKEALGETLIKAFPYLSQSEKQEALQSLSSRPIYGRQLANAIKEKVIAKREIPAFVARQLRRVVGNGFVEIWGPIDDISNNKEASYKKYRRLLSEQAIAGADPMNGRLVYQRACWACHQMYGDGGLIGPDLTGSNRSNLSYLLGNILDPSEVIQDDYKMVVVTTQDGRTYSGNVVSENDQQLTLRVVGQDEVVLSKSTIRTRELTENSLMPEGLLETLSNDEVLDLVAYLRTTEQVELPEDSE